ncbi:Putative FYVE finger-containing phosphoinositide kinase [Trichuris trichiura]|uniref:1-phosphatidylinositol-3-phosphate 5-kinase n=1 Tax=Trichuris trichiura TaxID=36087 RepID=A0A077Z3X9_TRITR|nr:Putative FYVE finger-containing phosphoinositide kinase [Trichuris trichiura]
MIGSGKTAVSNDESSLRIQHAHHSGSSLPPFEGEAEDQREAGAANDNLADYNRSNFRQCWMPDSRGKVCYECREKFTTFRRKHHCRICGQIFCSRCCSLEVSGRLFGYTTDLRVCNFCHNMVRNNRLTTRTGNPNSGKSKKDLFRSVPDMGTPFSGFASDSNASYSAEALLKRDIVSKREHSAPLANASSLDDDGDSCLIEESAADGHFENFVDDPEPEWLREIQAADLNVDFLNHYSILSSSTPDQVARSSREDLDGVGGGKFDVQVQVSQNQPATTDGRGSGDASPLPLVRSPRAHPLAPSPLRPIVADTMHIFLEKLGRQLEYLLHIEDVPFDPWRDIIMQLAEQVAFTVQPETKTNGDDMSILSYVHVKTIRRCLQPSADLVYGTVCTKGVLRQHMLQRIRLPKILMIQGPIEYERTKGKFCSIDAIIMQESYHLRQVVHKVLAHQPDILIVEDSVASTAQELFSQSGLTVLHNVKRSAIQRIARCTRCDVVHSVEFKSRMGRCGLFRTEQVTLLDGSTKMLCRFEDCPPQLGCTILLSGPCKWQLYVVKKILKHLIASIYSARLEVEMLDSLQAVSVKESATFEHVSCRTCLTMLEEGSCGNESAGFPRDLIKCSPFIHPFPSKKRPSSSVVSWAEFCNDCTNPEFVSRKRLSLPLHPFIVQPLKRKANHLDTRRLLADYRAQGGKLLTKSFKSQCSNNTQSTAGALKALEGQMWFTNWRHPFAYCRFTALLSSYLLKSGVPSRYCINPHTFSVKLYGPTDLPLGVYLEDYCLDADCQCPREGCEEKMVNHIRRFVLGSTSVEVSVHAMGVPPNSLSEESGSGNQIVLWSWCRHCKASTSERKMTQQFWQLSFATFLDYLFHGVRLSSVLAEETCDHCLFHDHVQFFARQNTLVSFRCQPISLFSTSFASLSLADEQERVTEEEFLSEVELVEQKADYLFNQMLKSVAIIVAQCETVGCAQQIANLVSELQSVHESAQRSFVDEMERLRAVVATLKKDENGFSRLQSKWREVEDSLVICHRILAAQMFAWNCIVCDFVACPLKSRWSDREADSTGKFVPDDLNGSAFDKNHNGSTSEDIPTRKQLSEELKAMQKVVAAAQLNSPFIPEQHFCLPIGKVPVAVDERQPGTIIAYALATNEYQDFVDSLGMDSEDIQSLLKEAASSSSSPEGKACLSESTTIPLEVQFSDSAAQFYCKMYFPKLFLALRTLLFPFDESTFVRSLASCERWQPTGGKSGAKFFRTRDRRFILKQMSHFELQSFVRFAPQYFAHVAASANLNGEEKSVSSLVKIFGAYRIGFKNSQTNAAFKTDLIVMEYLFYGRDVRQVYDLKGSQRNRHTSERLKQSTSTDLVLLDQNLMEKVCLESFYLNSASKAKLDEAIRNDTVFLSANHIMDYSLLMGVDQGNSVLLLGIIDYLRAYTWDKRIESWVKSVSVSGQLPTVVSPELYRLRFVESMDIYFPASPDRSGNVY